MHVTQWKLKIENICEMIQQPVLSKMAVMQFDISGALANLMMLVDLHVETEVTIMDGNSSKKYKTKLDQDYLVPIAPTPSLHTMAPLHAVARSVIMNTECLNAEYECLDMLESMSMFVVNEANYRKEANVLAVW